MSQISTTTSDCIHSSYNLLQKQQMLKQMQTKQSEAVSQEDYEQGWGKKSVTAKVEIFTFRDVFEVSVHRGVQPGGGGGGGWASNSKKKWSISFPPPADYTPVLTVVMDYTICRRLIAILLVKLWNNGDKIKYCHHVKSIYLGCNNPCGRYSV